MFSTSTRYSHKTALRSGSSMIRGTLQRSFNGVETSEQGTARSVRGWRRKKVQVIKMGCVNVCVCIYAPIPQDECNYNASQTP